MQGMNRETGKIISGLEHLRQSIEMILQTPLGSRVMRPEFGSLLYLYVAAPMTPQTDLKIYAATIDALTKNEPRLLTKRVEVETRTRTGIYTLRLTGTYRDEEIILDGIRINNGSRS